MLKTHALIFAKDAFRKCLVGLFAQGMDKFLFCHNVQIATKTVLRSGIFVFLLLILSDMAFAGFTPALGAT